MDDNTFECPNCGAKVYPEMTRCPQCGQNMYPEDEDQAQAEAESAASPWVSILGGWFIGWLITCGISLVLNLIVARLASPSSLGNFGKLALFLAGPLGAIVGGYVAAGIARKYSKLIGILVGGLALPMLVLFATHWMDVTPGVLLSAWSLLAGGLTILAGLAGAWLNETFIQKPDWKERWKVHGWEDLLYQDLLRKVRFNGSIADRLIEYERRQNPGASRLKLIQNAIERWERDNR